MYPGARCWISFTNPPIFSTQGGTHLKSDWYVPTSISKRLSVLTISLCKKGSHRVLAHQIGGSFGTGRGVIKKRGSSGTEQQIILQIEAHNNYYCNIVSHNLQKQDHCVRVYGVGHWVLDEFFKKGAIAPCGKTRGHQVLQGTIKRVIGYRTDQKRGSIDRHMICSHILECPFPPGLFHICSLFKLRYEITPPPYSTSKPYIGSILQ